LLTGGLGGRQLGDVGDDGHACQRLAEDQLQVEPEVFAAQTCFSRGTDVIFLFVVEEEAK
jgi:hypothetical protein